MIAARCCLFLAIRCQLDCALSIFFIHTMTSVSLVLTMLRYGKEWVRMGGGHNVLQYYESYRHIRRHQRLIALKKVRKKIPRTMAASEFEFVQLEKISGFNA